MIAYCKRRLNPSVVESTYEKAMTMLKAGCTFSEFGTRRRRSYYTQDLVMETILRAKKDCSETGSVNGTSNVCPARPFVVKPCD